MTPIGALTIEHRLIERVVKLIGEEADAMLRRGKVNPAFVDTATDFFFTYADKVHHGKEEDILFAALGDKPLSDEHGRTINELIEEHVAVRKMVGQLLLDKDRCMPGDASALNDAARSAKALAEFYPGHLAKEDKRFFRPSMEYFTQEERDEMLRQFAEFDGRQLHRKYKGVVEDLEQYR